MTTYIIAALAGYVAIGHSLVLKHASTAAAYSSNSNGTYTLSSVPAPVRGNISHASMRAWQLSIDDTPSGHKQTITGFGAAVTDATVASFNTLPFRTRLQLLDELMTPFGADFSLMRHTIGASDLSGNPAYTYDDNGGIEDKLLLNFNLGERGLAMALMLATMKSLQPNMKILGSSWSPPGWMKSDNAIDGTTTNNNLDDGYFGGKTSGHSNQFADYFVKYILAYEILGANIDAITIQNEPLNSQAGYPTMHMLASEQAHLIQNYVGPALANAGLKTKIWAHDDNTNVPSYPQTVLDNAGQYVDTVAWHCYATDLDWHDLTDFYHNNTGITQYMTECWTPASESWNHAARFTMGPLHNWASGVIAWTLGTNADNGPYLSSGGCDKCQGLVTVNNDGTYTLNMAYYMMAQFSKFIPPGAIILQGTGSHTHYYGGVQSVASLNPDGTRTVVIENTFSHDIYVTLNTNSREKWSGHVPAESVTTWVLPPAR
ncbi:putative beta-1,6-glucanase Neg1 [Talaromyces proteolyticus]|uniref:glucan endo-1,6-beta-glucosidase n=1 Tax=Talaromyces proteolyticus TaxID=1131652 RepID=A0AAD4KHW6_9EURO|nr:putative beta-1,6-glucanase Neg1 [Talaromyces proteolyticus]KAH8692100.1 putative beta-1,6-glucanase Neg1 [Talaromyces proteolyticus]